MENVELAWYMYLLGGVGVLTYLALLTIVSGFVGYGLTKGYQFATKGGK